MPPTISPRGKAALDDALVAAVADPLIPAQFWGVTTAQGPIYFNCGGERVLHEPEKGVVNEDTMLQLWSMTKLVTSVACLQLVDRGVLSLDDEELVGAHLPELAAQRILTGYSDAGEELWADRTEPITLRHLLSHTSGISYPEMPPTISRWQKEHNHPWYFAPNGGVKAFTVPLEFEPGVRWSYGLGIDWAGFLVERVTGVTLGTYFQEHIFAPLGITSLTFTPTPEVHERLMKETWRDAAGNLIQADPDTRLLDPATIKLDSGGAGLLGTAKDYLRFLQGVLASQSPGGIISPASFALLFTNTLPADRSARHYADMQAFMGEWGTYDFTADLGFSVALAVNAKDAKSGRRAGSGAWGGMAKTDFWIDPASGIAGFCGTQLVGGEVNPDPFAGVYAAFERQVYDALE
ncbi:Acyltransferase LovD [Vanrija pseudolonga]|uniref:Acyltransferase LovD n=1 Tax=Vanrija pseudolonga TaxID=143232 RepID=A0AAF0Y9N6_9TREE|nr:Acyltransferase LovD [Vanrija pseudolonga]